MKGAFWRMFDGIQAPPGRAAVDEERRPAEAFADRHGYTDPAAVRCLTATLPELTVHLPFPTDRWRRICHSNFIERTLGEVRRR